MSTSQSFHVTSLGKIGGQKNAKFKDFSGQTVRSQSDLPEFLLGCRIDRSAFVIEQSSFLKKLFGKNHSFWSCSWTDEKNGSSLNIRWDSKNDWNFQYVWNGFKLFSAFSEKRLPFEASLAFEVADGLARKVMQNPLGLPVDPVQPGAENTLPCVSLPDGFYTDVCVISSSENEEEEQRFFKTLGDLSLPAQITGCTAIQPAENRFSDGREPTKTSVAVLHIKTPFYQAPEIIRKARDFFEKWASVCLLTWDTADRNLSLLIPHKAGSQFIPSLTQDQHSELIAGATAVSNGSKSDAAYRDKDPESAVTPFGVPLPEIAAVFQKTLGCTARFEDGKLFVKSESAEIESVIEVIPPPEGSAAEIAALITIKAPFPDSDGRPQAELCSPKALSELNTMAAGSSFYEDKDGKLFAGTRLTWFVRDNAWRDVQRVLSAASAYDGIAPFFSFKASDSEEISAWNYGDFSMLQNMYGKYFVCSSDSEGFTAEYPLAGTGYTAAEGAVTALIKMDAGVHPVMGGGLLCLLAMPNNFPSKSKCYEIAARLNQLEMKGDNTAYHFGAWCSKDGETLHYVSFISNGLKGNGSLTMNWPAILVSRAKWAYGTIQNMLSE